MLINCILLFLLFICMDADVREHAVPSQLSIGFLIGSMIYAIMHAFWVPLILVVALILISDIRARCVRISLSFVFYLMVCNLKPDQPAMYFAILFIWLLWEYGALGGADVKLLFGILLVLSIPIVLLPISLIAGIQGIIAQATKKKEIPFVVSIFGGTAIFTLLPLFR